MAPPDWFALLSTWIVRLVSVDSPDQVSHAVPGAGQMIQSQSTAAMNSPAGSPKREDIDDTETRPPSSRSRNRQPPTWPTSTKWPHSIGTMYGAGWNPPGIPGSGGRPPHLLVVLADADGRPHLTAVDAFWVDGHYYFCGGPRSRKIRNIERDSRCALGVALEDYDVALEGRAVRVTEEADLQRLARVFSGSGWAPTVAEGGFTHQFGAPSAGPPPWYVYQFTPQRRVRGDDHRTRRRHPLDLLTPEDEGVVAPMYEPSAW